MNATVLTRVCGVVAAAGLVAATWATGADPAGAASLEPSQLVREFDTDQRDHDVLPEFLVGTHVGEGLLPETARKVGSSDVAEFWAAMDADGRLCLVSVLLDGTAASSCSLPVDFFRYGAALALAGSEASPDMTAEAYLVPADVELPSGGVASRSKNALEESDSTQLFVVGRDGSNPPDGEFARAGVEEPFQFQPLDVDA